MNPNVWLILICALLILPLAISASLNQEEPYSDEDEEEE